MNRRYSAFFSDLALLVFLFAMLASSVSVALAASALAFVGWLHGVLAVWRARRWGWLAAMLGAGVLLLLAWVQSDAQQIQLGFLHLHFLMQSDMPIFQWVLPGFLLAPTVLYALVARSHTLADWSLAPFSAHPEALSGGLILLGLFLIIATMRFGYNGMNVRLYF